MSVTAMNPYDVLGVARGASMSDIRKAYKRQALQCHPDRKPGDPAAEERFKQVAQAYKMLQDGHTDSIPATADYAQFVFRNMMQGFCQPIRHTVSVTLEDLATSRVKHMRVHCQDGSSVVQALQLGPHMRTGTRLRLTNHACAPVIFEIQCQPHPTYERGSDGHLVYHMCITVYEAMFGFERQLRDVRGQAFAVASNHMPASGQLRLAGRGMDAHHDLVVHVHLQLPTRTFSATEQACIRELFS